MANVPVPAGAVEGPRITVFAREYPANEARWKIREAVSAGLRLPAAPWPMIAFPSTPRRPVGAGSITKGIECKPMNRTPPRWRKATPTTQAMRCFKNGFLAALSRKNWACPSIRFNGGKRGGLVRPAFVSAARCSTARAPSAIGFAIRKREKCRSGGAIDAAAPPFPQP